MFVLSVMVFGLELLALAAMLVVLVVRILEWI